MAYYYRKRACIHLKRVCYNSTFVWMSLFRGDHTSVDCNMAVLPSHCDAVVFSIDGSFLASYSLRGIDPKIRGGAVDVVRFVNVLLS